MKRTQKIENIQKLEGKTCLIVTHRPAALKICSRHFILEDGGLREE